MKNKPTPKETMALIMQMKLTNFSWWNQVIMSMMQMKAVRYFFAAGTATVVDISVYWVVLNPVLHQKNHNFFDMFVFKAPTTALMCSYSCGLITNFMITKYFVFNESEAETKEQVFRFILVAAIGLGANYLLMSFLISSLHWYPTLARAISAVLIGLFSFTAHKFFSFKM